MQTRRRDGAFEELQRGVSRRPGDFAPGGAVVDEDALDVVAPMDGMP